MRPLYKKDIGNGVDCLLLVVFLSAMYVFYMMAWGRYVLFVVSGVALAKWALAHRERLVISRDLFRFVTMPFLLALYCYLSSLWAWDASLSISKGTTLLLIALCFAMLYPNYSRRGSIEPILLAILLSGVVVSLYTVSYYGPERIGELLTEGIRTENDFANANDLGQLMAMSILILYFYLTQGRKGWLALLLVPLVVVLIVTQSRSAFIMTVFGLFLLTVTGGRDRRLGKRLLWLLGGVAVLAALLYALSHLAVFSGIYGRFERMFDIFAGTVTDDARTIYRRIGLEQFAETPLLGIGMGNSPRLLLSHGERATYLHDNFVELLACGGIVAFAIYYAVYAYLYIALWHYRRFRPATTRLCLILLLLLTVMDYSYVSYSEKQHYLYLLCFYLQVDFLRRDSRRAAAERGMTPKQERSDTP